MSSYPLNEGQNSIADWKIHQCLDIGHDFPSTLYILIGFQYSTVYLSNPPHAEMYHFRLPSYISFKFACPTWRIHHIMARSYLQRSMKSNKACMKSEKAFDPLRVLQLITNKISFRNFNQSKKKMPRKTRTPVKLHSTMFSIQLVLVHDILVLRNIFNTLDL